MKIKRLKIIQSSMLTLIGVISVFMTLSVIFNLFGIRKIEGNFVPFVVYANLVCGVLYLIAAYSTWRNVKLSSFILGVALILLIVTFVGLFMHINSGGVYEMKTVKAMTFRTVFTTAMLVIGIVLFKKEKIVDVEK